MINKVLIALSAVLAVAAAMPFFDTGVRGEGFEYEYENNENVWGNAPLKANPFEYKTYKAQMANELNQDDGVNVIEGAEAANQEAIAGDDSGDQGGAGAGGQAFGGADAFANRGATFNNGIVEPAAAGGSSNDDNYVADTVAAVATGAGQDSQEGAGAQGAGAQGAAVNNAPLSPVVNAPDAAAVAEDDSIHVNAVGAPPPGELMSKSSGGQGLGIAVGVSLLVVATAAVAVVAIRYHRRYRF